MCIVTTVTAVSIAQEDNESDWWLTPHRMIQTNLREIDATMDTDLYVREVQEFGANVVLFNVGGIVANYPTQLKYHWRNTHMEGDRLGTVLPKLHAAGVKMIGRFDFSKINEQYAVENPQWLYVGENGEHVNYNGQVHTCLIGGYQQKYMYEILEEAITNYPLDGVFFNMIGFPQNDYSRVYHGICQCENCKTSFKAYCGLDLPKHEGDPDVLRKLNEWQQLQIGTQFGRVRSLVKSVRKDIAICTYTEEHIDLIRKESSSPIGEEPWDVLQKTQWTLLTNPGRQLANASNHFHQMIFRHSGVAQYLVNVLARPRPLVVAGRLEDYGNDFPALTFEMRLRTDPEVGSSKIFVPAERHYANGFRVEFGAGLTLDHHPGDMAFRLVQAKDAVDKEQAKLIRWDENQQRLIVERWTGKARQVTVTIQPQSQ